MSLFAAFHDLEGEGTGFYAIFSVNGGGVIICSECGSELIKSPPYLRVEEFKSKKFSYTAWFMFDCLSCNLDWQDKYRKATENFIENTDIPALTKSMGNNK